MQVLIKFESGQGLGNQLWLLATGLMYAASQDSRLGILSFENFKAHELLNFDELAEVAEIMYDSDYVVNKLVEKKLEHSFTGVAEYFIDVYDVNAKQTLLSGNFQRIDILLFSKHIMTKILRVDVGSETSDDECIVSIRGGEYKSNKQLVVGRNYYEHAINYMKSRGVKKFYICTDDYEYSELLNLNDCEIKRGPMISDFNYLATARNVISSNSSFVHWPLAINKYRPHIVAPLYWSRFNTLVDEWPNLGNYTRQYHWMSRNGEIISDAELEQKIINSKKPKPTFRDFISTLIFKIHNRIK
jgi:hypothetical protein